MELKNWKILLFLSVCDLDWARSQFTPVIEVTQGKLRGLTSVFGQNQYYSIPYATSERFEPPKEPPKWDGVFNAINPYVRCPQKISILTTGTEDCLYLDVHAPPSVNLSDKYPVMVFFHGGAYYKGSKELYDPQFLVIKGTVVVTVNYRLGVLGFLCLNGVSNLGLRDQVAALKWVQKNIAAFGGDPHNVALCGQSAGASSASMHQLSESSKGLFHKAILMSGTALSPWAFNLEPLAPALDDARKISAAHTEADVFHTFAQAPLPILMDATRDTSVNPRYFKYSPCVDVNSTEPFFKDAPYSILKSGRYNKVPLMVGYTDNEGGFFYRLLNTKTVNDLSEHFNGRLPSVFSWCSDKDRHKIGEMFRLRYFGIKSIDYLASVKELLEYYSDWIAYGAINAFSQIVSRVSEQPVYNYQFSYEGDRNFGKFIAGTDFNGTTHGDELFYMFKLLGISLPLLNQDLITIDRFTTMVRNFMKYGNPTPKNTKLLPLKWLPATVHTSNIFVLNTELALIDRPRVGQRGEFFFNMLCTYGRSGYVPCESRQMCKPR